MIVKLLTISKLKRRLQRLVPVYTCENVKLLEKRGFYGIVSLPRALSSLLVCICGNSGHIHLFC